MQSKSAAGLRGKSKSGTQQGRPRETQDPSLILGRRMSPSIRNRPTIPTVQDPFIPELWEFIDGQWQMRINTPKRLSSIDPEGPHFCSKCQTMKTNKDFCPSAQRFKGVRCRECSKKYNEISRDKKRLKANARYRRLHPLK